MQPAKLIWKVLKALVARQFRAVIVSDSRFFQPSVAKHIFYPSINMLKGNKFVGEKYSPFTLIIIMRPSASLTCC